VPPSPTFRGDPYRPLKRILDRHPLTEEVRYQPSVAEKRYLEATVASERLDDVVGPESPRVTVRWTRDPPYDEYRVDFSDPNVDFHCGWHSDDDHPEYGPLHFQYDHHGLDQPVYEAVTVEPNTPPRILWELLDRLFEDVVAELVVPLYD
jgi:hypothetical protein